MKEIPIADEIKDALLGEKNRLRDVFDFALICEKGDWEKLPDQTARLGIKEARAYQLYLDALRWSYQCFQGRTGVKDTLPQDPSANPLESSTNVH